ncbi:hypothetical protein AALP_AAs48803U000200 [Arabis alpina]|uniref:C2 domain-containing protein n=1 Tax=Arabis alpina TaxID=50452 RepID=A0A087G0Q3_ARAAL|nr:hypothetical protein AALP_AAs48803U000200 [Arabis alpina]
MSSSKSQMSLENPTLELKIVSASEINHIDATDKIDVYAVVSITGDTTQPKQAAKTPIDYDGGSNPTWNHTAKFSINEREANESLLTVKVKLFSYWLEGEGDLYLGEVNVPVQELLVSNPIPPFVNGNVNKMKSMTCPIKVMDGGSTKATLSLSYRFKPVLVDDLHPPAPVHSPSTGHPPVHLPSIGQPPDHSPSIGQPPDHSPSIGQPVYPNPEQTISSGQPVVYSPRFQTGTTKLILEVVIKYAKDIEDVNAFSAMDVYASIAILKDRRVKDRINTPIAFSAYTNPKWNHKIKCSLDETLAQDGRLILLVELMSHRPFLGDKEIGFVRLPIQQLLRSNPPSSTNGEANSMKLETHALTGPYGKKGVVSFTYRFLTEQVNLPPPQSATTTPQPYVMYLPVSPRPYPSSNPIQVSSGYVTVQPAPIYMPPTYQSQGYNQYSPGQLKPQPPSQQSQLKPLPQQPFPQSLPDTQEA